MDFMKFFLHLGFAACIPAIISGGVSERAKFWTNTLAGAIFVGLAYPLLEAIFWTGLFPIFSFLKVDFYDYAGSVIVHSFGGWLALPAIYLLGKRK